MKNKKFLCLVLALVMVLGAFGPVFAETKAADDAKKVEDKKVEDKKVEVKKVTGRDNKIQYLIDNKFVEGRKVNEDPKDNDLALDKTIKRSEITKLLVYAIGRQDLAKKVQGVKIYSDVEATYWANGVITVGTTMASPANNVAFLNGYPDGSFKPENDVTYGELAKMLVTLVKPDLTQEMHDKANKPGVWPAQWITWAADLGILEDVKIEDANKPAVRSDAFVMLYNALYALRYVKKYAATDELGILSQLKNKKLTLNQGDKKKEYTITDDTTFILYNQYNPLDVQADNAKDFWTTSHFSRVVKVGAIDNPEYFYGSLLRVITDDKGNVTHVLELGNPDLLALANNWDEDNIRDKDYKWNVNPNNRWSGVADATAETSFYGDFVKYLKDFIDNDDNGGMQLIAQGLRAAKFHFNANGTAKEIAIYQGAFKGYPENIDKDDFDPNNFAKYWANSAELVFEAKLDKNTRYFVADVAKNQLTELDNLDQALLTLGGTRNENWFMDAYVGYDSFDGTEKHETSGPTAVNGYNVAKVVVFNSVKKDNNNAQLLRVKNEATRLYDVTFEKTDGTEVVFNIGKYREAFPFDFKDRKLNVVEITENAADGIHVDVKIDNGDPKVEVIKVDGKKVYVKDEHGDFAVLQRTFDCEQFLEQQELKPGTVIQFHTLTNNKVGSDVNKNNVVDIISILPKGTKPSGKLQGVVQANPGNIAFGHLKLNDIKVSTGTQSKVIDVLEYRSFIASSDGAKNKRYHVTLDDAELLEYYLTNVPKDEKGNLTKEDDFIYLVEPYLANTVQAKNFQVLVEELGTWVDLEDVVAYYKIINAHAGLVDPVTTDEEAQAIKDVVAAYKALTAKQKALFVALMGKDGVKNLEDDLTLKEEAVQKYEEGKQAKAVDDQIKALAQKPNLDEEAIKAARAAYDALNDDQKALVDEATLTAREEEAKKADDDIKAEFETKAPGKKLDHSSSPYSKAADKTFAKIKSDLETNLLSPGNGVTIKAGSLKFLDGEMNPIDVETELEVKTENQKINVEVTYTKDGIERTETIEFTYKVDA